MGELPCGQGPINSGVATVESSVDYVFPSILSFLLPSSLEIQRLA